MPSNAWQQYAQNRGLTTQQGQPWSQTPDYNSSNPPSYQGPNAPYGQPMPNGWTWDPYAAENFSQQNGFDPTTGAPIGPGSVPPANMAIGWQAEHDRRVWNYRQNLMRSAHNYGRGALGLLQSFRPGGSAAIEAGQYNNLANIQLQRAALTQPLDLMGDYRRDEAARARQAANRQAERQMAVQAAGVVVGAATGNWFGAASSLANLAGTALGIGQQPQQQTTTEPGTQPRAGFPQQQQGAPAAQQQGAAPQQGGGGAGMPGAPGGGGAGSPGESPAIQNNAQQPPGYESTLSGGGEQGGVDGPGGEGQQGGQQGMAAPGVGADGNFTPVAYAARGAAMAADPFQQLALSRSMASEIEHDPLWDALAYGIDKRLASRIAA